MVKFTIVAVALLALALCVISFGSAAQIIDTDTDNRSTTDLAEQNIVTYNSSVVNLSFNPSSSDFSFSSSNTTYNYNQFENTSNASTILDDNANASLEWWDNYWNTDDSNATAAETEDFFNFHPATTKAYIVSEYNRLRQDKLDWFWYEFLMIFLILCSIILIISICFHISLRLQNQDGTFNC